MSPLHYGGLSSDVGILYHYLNKKIRYTQYILILIFGAQGRNRTDTVSLPLDFESSASTNFTTRAACIIIN